MILTEIKIMHSPGTEPDDPDIHIWINAIAVMSDPTGKLTFIVSHGTRIAEKRATREHDMHELGLLRNSLAELGIDNAEVNRLSEKEKHNEPEWIDNLASVE